MIAPRNRLAASARACEQTFMLDRVEPPESVEDLVRDFCDSPEAEALTDIRWSEHVADLAAEDGVSIASLDAPRFRRILFERIPSKARVDASKARAIIDELRAFFLFVARVFDAPRAVACLKVLGARAARELERALSEHARASIASCT
ncbi:MAG: hypothetical protein KF819_35290 [Labilithrix sp.]|nr:hypothetical protein [Labilithrix sp.]